VYLFRLFQQRPQSRFLMLKCHSSPMSVYWTHHLYMNFFICFSVNNISELFKRTKKGCRVWTLSHDQWPSHEKILVVLWSHAQVLLNNDHVFDPPNKKIPNYVPWTQKHKPFDFSLFVPPIGSVWTVRIGLQGKYSELFWAVLCMVVVHNDMHTCEQFAYWFRFRFRFCVFVYMEWPLCVFLVLAYIILFLLCLLLLCRFRFFSTKPRDWLGRTSCRVGRKTLTQSMSPFVMH